MQGREALRLQFSRPHSLKPSVQTSILIWRVPTSLITLELYWVLYSTHNNSTVSSTCYRSCTEYCTVHTTTALWAVHVIEVKWREGHNMAIALALLKVGLERETSQQRSSVQTRESVVRGENNMLRLHENLSTSLYKNKDRSNEKLSLKIVLVVTLVSAGQCNFHFHQDFLFSSLPPWPLGPSPTCTTPSLSSSTSSSSGSCPCGATHWGSRK